MTPSSAVSIPIVGRVSTGETFVPFDATPMTGGHESLAFIFEEGDPIAVEVRGESMLPFDLPAVQPKIRCGAQCIVTDNLTDFPAEVLAKFDITPADADSFPSPSAPS